MKTLATLKTTLIALCIIGGLTSCQNLPEVAGTEILLIDDKKIESYMRQVDQAKFTLIFENGAANCIHHWAKVLKQLPTDVNIYAYNRPGYCNSSPANTDRNSKNIADELHVTLDYLGFKPPYVLIGHSLGGLYVQHFARQFPREVHGIVLVDALSPGVFKQPNEFPWYVAIGKFIFLSNAVRNELDLAHASGAMIDSLPSIDNKPIVRMFNAPKGEGNVAVDFGVFNQDIQTLEKVEQLYPHAKNVVADSSHQMQDSSPELVIQAIKDVMQSSKPLN